MWWEIGAAVGAGSVVGLAAWGLRLIREIQELEGLSKRVVGPPGDLVRLWSAPEDQAS